MLEFNKQQKPTCIVPECNADHQNRRTSIKYHCVPRNNIERAVKWLIAVNRKDLSSQLQTSKLCVCSFHFSLQNFIQGKLKRTAVPDENLPLKLEDVNQNDFIRMSQDVVDSEYQHLTAALIAAEWSNTCRACLTPLTEESESLLDAVNSLLFQQCTALTHQDYLPQSLCAGCQSKCWDWFKFKMQCEQSQCLLDSVLKCRLKDALSKDSMKKEKYPQPIIVDCNEDNFNNDDDFKISDDLSLNCNGCNTKIPYALFFEHQCQLETISSQDEDKSSQLIVQPSFCDDVHNDMSCSTHQTDSDDNFSDNALVPLGMRKKWKFKIEKDVSQLDEIVEVNNSLVCPNCDLKFKQLAKLKPHLVTHALVKEPKCIKCDKIFANTMLLEEHCVSEHNNEVVRNFCCQYCDSSFSRYKFLLKHTYKHEGVLAALSHGTKYKCPKCDDIKISETALKNHVKECIPYSYICPQCNKAFKSPTLLRRHKSEHNPNEYLCNTCGKVYKCKSSLKAHALTHMERTAKCEMCHRNFFGTANLNKHMKRVHSAEKHACEFCLMEFKSSKAIRAHMATHMARQFKCDFCERTFKFHSSLEKHKEKCFPGKKVATKKKSPGEVVYCPICGMDFAAVPAVRQHLQEVHRNDGIDIDRAFESIKVFSCSECGKTFATMRNLKDHMATHSANKPHECDVCKKRFRDTSQLAVHLIKHKNELITHQGGLNITSIAILQQPS